ncbi:hypothetical protein DFH09DRAFT_1087705 [Mycena vulgaris]|nr:hypothetical protein DFH09DRAFT_1087705 [Mycena vulgaris]
MARGIQNHPLAPQTVPQRASKSAFQGRNPAKKICRATRTILLNPWTGGFRIPQEQPKPCPTAPEKRFSPQQWLGSWMMASDAMEAPSTWEPPRKWWKWLIVAMTSPPQKCSYQVNIHRGWIEKVSRRQDLPDSNTSKKETYPVVYTGYLESEKSVTAESPVQAQTIFHLAESSLEFARSSMDSKEIIDSLSHSTINDAQASSQNMCEQSSASDSTIFTPESSSGQIQPKQDESSAERETKDFPFKGDSILSSMTSLIWTYHHPNPRLYYASITHNFKQTSFINILEYNYACQLRPTRFHCLSGEIHNEHVMLEIVKDERGFLLYQIISNPEFVLAETTMLVCQGATSGTWEVANLHEICGGFMYMCCLNPDKRQVTLIHILRQYYQVEESGGMSLVQAICGGAHKGK